MDIQPLCRQGRGALLAQIGRKGQQKFSLIRLLHPDLPAQGLTGSYLVLKVHVFQKIPVCPVIEKVQIPSAADGVDCLLVIAGQVSKIAEGKTDPCPKQVRISQLPEITDHLLRQDRILRHMDKTEQILLIGPAVKGRILLVEDRGKKADQRSFFPGCVVPEKKQTQLRCFIRGTSGDQRVLIIQLFPGDLLIFQEIVHHSLVDLAVTAPVHRGKQERGLLRKDGEQSNIAGIQQPFFLKDRDPAVVMGKETEPGKQSAGPIGPALLIIGLGIEAVHIFTVTPHRIAQGISHSQIVRKRALPFLVDVLPFRNGADRQTAAVYAKKQGIGILHKHRIGKGLGAQMDKLAEIGISKSDLDIVKPGVIPVENTLDQQKAFLFLNIMNDDLPLVSQADNIRPLMADIDCASRFNRKRPADRPFSTGGDPALDIIIIDQTIGNQP